jgi:prepilin-type N-terminal cleavage/methylation domain-containing protein
MKKDLQLTTYNLQPKKGFTLIELLVVMAIVAILSAISLFALQGARGSGRDAKRKADLQQIASGLELYHSDCHVYPNVSSLPTTLDGSVAPCAVGSGNVYIQSVPDDPNTSNHYRYQKLVATCTTNCTRYRVWAALEVQPTPALSFTGACPSSEVPSDCGGVACNYCVTNP